MPCHPRRATAVAPGDRGFTMIESVVSIAVIGVVMAALASFFITTMTAIHHQGGRQVAIQLTNEGIDRVRGLTGSDPLNGQDAAAAAAHWNAGIDASAEVATALEGFSPAVPADGADGGTSTAGAAGASGAGGAAGAAVLIPATTEPTPVPGYDRDWYVSRCWQEPRVGTACGPSPAPGYLEFFRVVVAVSWADRACGAHRCVSLASTLVVAETTDPVFNSNDISGS